MIDIQRYRELLLELKEQVNQESETPIDGIAVAVSEKHLIKKLKDSTGLMLCANYPDAVSQGGGDNYSEQNNLILFLIEKVPSGKETDEEELLHYARIQRVMQLLKSELREMNFVCGEVQGADGITTEWEYDIFGGWNGMSVGLKITDYE